MSHRDSSRERSQEDGWDDDHAHAKTQLRVLNSNRDVRPMSSRGNPKAINITYQIHE